jgi:DNA-binding SARP family transcriptional activator/tetratricopeptide (TPR) repeat protein
MDVRVLGPLEASAGGRPLSLGGGKPRALLTMLALQAGSPVSADHLIEGLWGESPPATANKMIQIFVSQVRKALDASGDAGRLVTRGRGYELRIDADDVDALRFERLLAAQAPREALALWRGPPLEELSGEPFAAAEIRRLEELRLAALEQAVEQDLAAGRHREVIGELDALVAQEPLNERFHAQRMLALYRSGRQSDALAAYRHARETLIDEVGLEPGPELQGLNDAMLQHDPSLAAPAAAATPAAPAPAVNERRQVTVLCAGIAIAADLDPEALHRQLARFSDRFAAVVERHGGTVERTGAEIAIGFFGLTAAHEDDVLRALRAALELRDPQITAGIDTGELFVGEQFSSGQPLSRARRLHESAPEGSILLTPDVHRLVEQAALAEPIADLDAWQLVDLRPEETEPLHTGPFVGRSFELDALRGAFDEARAEPGCRMVTVVGPAGIGKSRLARELVTSIGSDATVVVGRCVSYGVGITFGPVAEIVRQLGGPPRVAELLTRDPLAAQRVLGAIGESDEPGQAEEIFWGFRRLLEEAAREQPLVVAVEDVHWAEPTLLDLLEYLAAFSRELPILLVCLARPELLETRPEWTTPQAGRSVHVLQPLGADDAHALAKALGANGQSARIVEAAEGNPLFLEQLVAVGEEGEALPPTIHAVLAARIDRLEPGERAVLLRASVEGRTFHAGALRELLPEAEQATMSQHLVGLVRKQLIRVDRPQLPGEDAFRFAHALVREAAYEGLSKELRAELHERLGRWLDERPETPEEIVAFNLEQAHLLRTDLGTASPELGDEAASRLESAARAALARGDARAGAALLERAVALLDDLSLLPRLGAALFEAGRLADADAVLARAIDHAEETGDEHMEALARVERELVALEANPGGEVEPAAQVAEAALDVLARHHDERGQSRAWSLRAAIAWLSGQVADADEAWDHAAQHAKRAGDDRELFEILGWQASAAVFGPTPVKEAIARCARIRKQVSGSPVAVAVTLHPLAALHAMTGDFDQARRLLSEGNAILGELGRMESAVSHHEALVEMLAGRPDAAEARLRVGYDELVRMGGDGSLLATTAAMLAQAVFEQDRVDEAAELCVLAARTAPREDLVTQVVWRGVQGKVLARGERFEEAEPLAREAVALVEQTDLLTHHGDALLDLATVLRLMGQTADAEAAWTAGCSLHERKGNVAATERSKRMEVS